MQAMQRHIRTELDNEIEAQGFDVMRSRITIRLTDGSEVAGWADERYRGGPDNPLSDAEVEAKVRSCCDGVLDDAGQDRLIEAGWNVTGLPDAAVPCGVAGIEAVAAISRPTMPRDHPEHHNQRPSPGLAGPVAGRLRCGSARRTIRCRNEPCRECPARNAGDGSARSTPRCTIAAKASAEPTVS